MKIINRNEKFLEYATGHKHREFDHNVNPRRWSETATSRYTAERKIIELCPFNNGKHEPENEAAT